MRVEEDERRRVRRLRKRLTQQSSERNELLAEGLEELWEPERIADSEDALDRALRDVFDPH